MSRLITATVAIAVLLGTVGEHRTPVRHNETLDLAVSVNHIAVIGDSYTTGGDLGGLGSNGWTVRAWQWLSQQGVPISADVAAEGGAGYGTRGNRGSVFEDLTADAVKPDDAGGVLQLRATTRCRPHAAVDSGVGHISTRASHCAEGTVSRHRAAMANADPPDGVLRVRDALKYQAGVAGATFIDPIATGWFVGRPDLIGKDGIHPTDAGHAYMAEMIAPLIRSQLS